jgi:hypothetical protein
MFVVLQVRPPITSPGDRERWEAVCIWPPHGRTLRDPHDETCAADQQAPRATSPCLLHHVYRLQTVFMYPSRVQQHAWHLQ